MHNLNFEFCYWKGLFIYLFFLRERENGRWENICVVVEYL
jgi:hypothetical protein